MQALENATWLLENDLVKRPKKKKESVIEYEEARLLERRTTLSLIANRADTLNQRFYYLTDLEYQLAILRMTFTQNDIIWDDVIEPNDIAPRLSKAYLIEKVSRFF